MPKAKAGAGISVQEVGAEAGISVPGTKHGTGSLELEVGAGNPVPDSGAGGWICDSLVKARRGIPR